MVYVGEGYEITSAGIRKIENYGMQPKEDNPYVLFTHYEPEVPSVDGLKSLLEYTQNRVNYPPPIEVGVFLHFMINNLKKIEETLKEEISKLE